MVRAFAPKYRIAHTENSAHDGLIPFDEFLFTNNKNEAVQMAIKKFNGIGVEPNSVTCK